MNYVAAVVVTDSRKYSISMVYESLIPGPVLVIVITCTIFGLSVTIVVTGTNIVQHLPGCAVGVVAAIVEPVAVVSVASAVVDMIWPEEVNPLCAVVISIGFAVLPPNSSPSPA